MWAEVLNSGLIKGIVSANLSYVSELSTEEVDARRWTRLDGCKFSAMTLFQVETRGVSLFGLGDAATS